MELKDEVKALTSTLFKELSYHPLIYPYLNVSKDVPLQHYLHQYEVIARLALRNPVRALIGDEIGLGKTVTAIAIAKFLEGIGRVKRTLIIVPRVLVGQWRKELRRMGIPLSKVKLIESYTLDSLKARNFPEGYYIASMDLLKREERIEDIVGVPWDLVVVDEVHKFGYKTKRFWNIGKMLIESKPERNVLFLSATPHRGDPKDYILRLRLIDPYLVEGWRALDNRQFYEATHGSILFRRTKEDINKIYEERQVFTPANFYAAIIGARDDELKFVSELVEFLRSKLVEFAYERSLISEKVIPLLTILIFKRTTSSPYAAWTTLERLLIRRAEPEFPKELIDSVRSFIETGFDDYEYARDPEDVFNDFLGRTSSLLSDGDVERIKKLRDSAKSIMDKGDSKLNALTSLLEDIMAEKETKVIVFTEYKDTADYLINYLVKRHPEWKRSILKLTSEETSDEALYQSIKERFEKDPRARILVVTDVVAEGVNLQVANILVNYEIPWSLIKLEQRVGRVWRLGQTRDVEAYTLFMNNVADRAALNSMYEKLMNLKRALGPTRPIIGQDVVYYAEAADLTRLPPQIAIVEKAKRKKFVKVTEGKSILTYLRKGEAGLEHLVASIIAAKRELEREIESKGILHRPKTKREVEAGIKPLAFQNPQELLNSLKSVLRATCKILGYKVIEGEDGSLRIVRGTEMPMSVETVNDIYSILTAEGYESTYNSLVAYSEHDSTIILLPVHVLCRKDGPTIYRELVGVHVENKQVLRGSALLEMVSRALSSCFGVSEVNLQNFGLSLMLKVSLIDEFKRSISEILAPFRHYSSKLKELGLRDIDETSVKISDMEVKIQKPLCLIQFVKRPLKPMTSPPEELKREVEERAMQHVMEVERREGRAPIRVSETEHYDVKSIEPSTGSVRLIEVKGHMGLEVYGELTEDEVGLAEEKGDLYWLYIVYDIKSGEPKHLKFRNPLKTMNWEVVERVERRFIAQPRE